MFYGFRPASDPHPWVGHDAFRHDQRVLTTIWSRPCVMQVRDDVVDLGC